MVDAAVGKNFGHVDFTIAATNSSMRSPDRSRCTMPAYRTADSTRVRRTVSILPTILPTALHLAGVGEVHRYGSRMTTTMPALRARATDGPQWHSASTKFRSASRRRMKWSCAFERRRSIIATFLSRRESIRASAAGNAGIRRRGGNADGAEVVIDPMLDWGDDARVWDASNSALLGMPRDGTFARYCSCRAKTSIPNLRRSRLTRPPPFRSAD